MVGGMVDALLAHLGLSSRPQAILWDMDGTLIDTEPEWLAASIEVVEGNGGIWHPDEDPQKVLGVSSEEHVRTLATAVARGGVEADGWELFGKVVQHIETHLRQGFTLIPGAQEILDAFHSAGIPQALVTASPKPLVQALFDGMAGHPLQAFVSGSDDVPGKPDPAPYLLGAERLGVDITQCLVFEDSVTGLAAARASGATVVSVNDTPLSSLLGYI